MKIIASGGVSQDYHTFTDPQLRPIYFPQVSRARPLPSALWLVCNRDCVIAETQRVGTGAQDYVPSMSSNHDEGRLKVYNRRSASEVMQY